MTNIWTLSSINTDIQALRAIAVSLVLFYHANIPFLSGGYIGVDIFFVISGFLITNLLTKEFSKTGSINLFRFYARRAKRLLPAACFVIFITTIACWHLYSPLQFKIFSSTAIASSVYLSNIWFAKESTNYLAESTDTNPLLHTWSLAVEEQFYIIWPAILILLYKTYQSGYLSKNKLLISVFTFTLISFSSSVWLTAYLQPWAFFSLPTRAWEFGVGALIAIALSEGLQVPKGLSGPLGWLGLVLILICSLTFNEQTVFPGYIAILPVLGTAFMIIASMHPSVLGKWLSLGPIQLVGNTSYSIYLWHWPILVLLPIALPIEPIYLGLLCIVLSLFLGWLTYITIENYFRYNNHLHNSTSGTLALGLGVTAILLIFIFQWRLSASEVLDTPLQKNYAMAKNDLPQIYDGCHTKQEATSLSKNCYFGKTDSKKSIVLFGDSHAAQWFPALEIIAKENAYKLISLTKSACPSINIEPFHKVWNRQYKECSIWRENAVNEIKKLNPELIIIANSKNYIHNGTSVKEWKEGIAKTIDALIDTADHLVFMEDTPWLDFDPLNCLSKAHFKNKSTTEACTYINPTTQIVNKKPLIASHIDLIGKEKKVKVIDMMPYICKTETCYIELGDTVIFRDMHHLTAKFSQTLSSSLLTHLPITNQNP